MELENVGELEGEDDMVERVRFLVLLLVQHESFEYGCVPFEENKIRAWCF